MESKEYPVHIIPTEGWNHDIKCDAILYVCGNAMIGRRIEGCAEDCIDSSLGEDAIFLKEEALATDEIPNLSTSLLGAKHEIDDFSFRQTGQGKAPWDKEEVSISAFCVDKDFVRIDTEFIVAGWSLFGLNNRDVPYRKTFNKKKEYDAFVDSVNKANESPNKEKIYLEEYEKLPKNEAGDSYGEYNGKVIVNHAPTKLNYWHFTVDLYPVDSPDKPLKGVKGAWREMMAENVADYLRRSFYILPDSDLNLPPLIDKWESLV